MSFDYSEFKELRDNFVKMENEYDIFIRKFLLEMALRVLAKTKKNTPVDTGLLRNSWQIGDSNYIIQTKVAKSGKNKGKLKVYDDPKNVSYKEATLNGVKRNGDTLEISIYNPIEYASWVEYGHSQEVGRYVPAIGKKLINPWVEGKYMATIAIKDIEDEIPVRFEQKFQQWIKELGVM